MPMTLALAGGSIVFLLIVIALVLILAYSVNSKHGSNIDAHPMEGDAAPGSGLESGLQDPDETQFRETFDDRGGR